MDLIKYIFEKPALTGRVVRWKMILTECDIQYTSQKAIKWSVLSDYLAQQPIEDYQPMKFEFPDEDISRCSDRKIESSRSRRRGLTLNPNGFWCLMGRLRRIRFCCPDNV